MTKSPDGGDGGHGALNYEGPPPEQRPLQDDSPRDPDHPLEHQRRWQMVQYLTFQPAMAEVILALNASLAQRQSLVFSPVTARSRYDLQRKYLGISSHSGSLFDREAA